MKRIIFLDVDGVLNNPDSGFGGFVPGGQLEYYHEQIKWDQDCVDQLRMLVKDSGAEIVVSSFWRKDFNTEDFKAFFSIYGWHNAPVIDRTEELDQPWAGGYSRFVSATNRGDECLEWLDRHTDVESYVILDDMTHAEFYMNNKFSDLKSHQRIGERLVVTDPSVGLSQSDAKKALEQLELTV